VNKENFIILDVLEEIAQIVYHFSSILATYLIPHLGQWWSLAKTGSLTNYSLQSEGGVARTLYGAL
jgi:hypothetical protein